MNLTFKLIILLALSWSCKNADQNPAITPLEHETAEVEVGRITPAAERIGLYLPLLQGKTVGMVVNQTSTLGSTHLVDYLLTENMNIMAIFSPEHGFRGTADAGQKINNAIDPKTLLPLISLYGKNKKPSPVDLTGIDVLLFDIQDVGVRFYTYISTLHYVMEAAAEQDIPVIVLDRPNPLSCYVDGPVLEPEFKSFVGMHPVPVVYGMTIGEYAQMINGEEWLPGALSCDLTVIPIENYKHSDFYLLPIKPSPNLPNNIAIANYPSLCFFEGTTVSIGRGTDKQFQVIGHPQFPKKDFNFTPVSGPGSKYPKLENTICHGIDLQKVKPDLTKLNLQHLIHFHQELQKQQTPFFNDDNFFNLLAGTDQLKKQIQDGIREEEIRASWAPGLREFKMTRKKYLLYE